jgi:hypothetical protein
MILKIIYNESDSESKRVKEALEHENYDTLGTLIAAHLNKTRKEKKKRL